MKTRLLIILIIGIIILVVGFTYLSYIQYTNYETWGNNEHWYYHPDGYKVECEKRLFQSPGQCTAIDEYENIVDTKTGLGNWNGVIWLGNPDFCKEQGGIWNNTSNGCYGLYEMCEKDGGITRFLKNSLPFPDIEENKPIPYLMDCYHAYTIEDNYTDEPVFTGTELFDDTSKQFINKFDESPIIYIVTEDGDDKVYPDTMVIDFEKTNSVIFVNNSTNSVRIQEVGENKIIDIPKDTWRTKVIAPNEELTIQFNSTGHYEFNVKKITDFFPDYLEHHETGEIVVLSNDTNSLPVEIRAKMAQAIVSSDFRKGVGLISVGSGSAEPGITIGIHEKFQDKYNDAEKFYYEKYLKMIPFDVPITIEFRGTISLD